MTAIADTDTLLDQIQGGDRSAVDSLLVRYRPRLRNLVSMRLDRRLAGRIDASDVVQDALVTAARKIDEYARLRPVPFYPWIRKLTFDRIVDVHREHIRAQRRSVAREAGPQLSEFGRNALAKQFAAVGDSPSQQMRRQEDIERAQSAVDQLSDGDREVLVLRYLEQSTLREAASILGISENAFAQRHLRALRRVRIILSADGGSHD